jgi:ATP-dependent Clp protease, protease subunit
MAARFDMTGEIGKGNCTAAAFRAFAANNPGPITVTINSSGGAAFEGSALLAEFERHGNVTTIGQGIVASAASLALMGGKEIVLHTDAAFMIHDPAASVFGTAEDHRGAAQTLDKLSDIYAKAYARASGNPIAKIKAWMAAETWLTASEALSLRFCDRIEGGDNAPVAQFDFTRFQHAPEHLVALARANGWAAVPSKSSKKETANA